MKPYKCFLSICLVLYQFSNIIYAASAYTLRDEIPEEGFRWRHSFKGIISDGNFNAVKGGKDIPAFMSAIEEEITTATRIAEEERIRKIVEAAKAEGREIEPEHPINKNYALGEFTIIINDSGEIKNKTISITSIPPPTFLDGKRIIFENFFRRYLTPENPVTGDGNMGYAGEDGPLDLASLKRTLIDLFSKNVGIISEDERMARLAELRLSEVEGFDKRWYIHSEQHMRNFLAFGTYRKFLVAKLTAGMPKDAKVLAMILHIHSRLDICKRCTQTWALEVNRTDTNSVFNKIHTFIAQKAKELGTFSIDPSFKSYVLATSREQSNARDGEDRRGRAGHDDINYDAPLDYDHMPVRFIQKVTSLPLPIYKSLGAPAVMGVDEAVSGSAGAGSSGGSSTEAIPAAASGSKANAGAGKLTTKNIS